MGMPGFGDSATWGPVWHPNDPRRDDSAADAFEAALGHAMETVQYHLDQAQKLIEKGDLKAAHIEYNKIAEVEL